MINDTLHETTGTIAKVLCALSLVVACGPAWSDPGKPRYEMAVFSDVAQGSKILTGKYDQAITKINAKTRATDVFESQTNLCVAYTKSGDLDAAEKVCDEAVAMAESLRKDHGPTYAATSSARIRARYVAIALSNRGVVKAVLGELDAARRDFDAAIALQAGLSSVRANLERLNSDEDSV